MVSVEWLVKDRNVVGLTEDVNDVQAIIPWSADPDLLVNGSMPWAIPEYPTLLITGIGVELVTSGTAGTRRLQLDLLQPNGGQTVWYSSGSQTANLTRRWECGVGFALETTLAAASVFREPLPRGFMMLPGRVGMAESQLTVLVNGFQSGDQLGPITIRGRLLYP